MVFQIQMMRNPELAPLTRDYIGEEERKFMGHLSSRKKASPSKAPLFVQELFF